MKRVNGSLLRSLRKSKGLNVFELSSATDVDRRTITSYERQSPEKAELNAVVKLATFFGLSVDELLTEKPFVPDTALASA